MSKAYCYRSKLDEFAGSMLAWSIATASILVSAIYGYRHKKGMPSPAIPALDFVAALVLSLIALDIFRSVPFFRDPISFIVSSPLEPLKTILEQTKISYLVLLIALLAGLGIASRKKKPKDVRRSLEASTNVAWKNFSIMTLLPVVVQYWVLVASTDRLTTYGGAFAIGMFVLAGPAAWQFAMRIVILSEKGRTFVFLKMLLIMLISLVGVLGATFFGVWLRGNPTLIDATVLRYVAGFTLIAIPYFFFYSYWGEKWSENRPIAVVIAMVVVALYASMRIEDPMTEFVSTMLIWAVIVALPYTLYSNESVRTTYACPECSKKDGLQVRIYRDTKICTEHSDLVSEETKVEERKSFARLLFMLLFERCRSRAWGDEMLVTIDPNKEKYATGENVTIIVQVLNSNKRTKFGIHHAVHCRIDIRWIFDNQDELIGFSSKWIEPGGKGEWSYSVQVPLPPPKHMPGESKLHLEVTSTFFEIRPKNCFDQRVRFPYPRKITLKKTLESSGSHAASAN